MNEPQPWVYNAVLYAMTIDKKPFVNGTFVGLFINNIWCPLDFNSAQCDLSKSMNIFLWCPADQQSQQYAKEEGDVVTEQNDAPMSQGKAKIGRSVPVLAKCTEARDVISALLWMAAAVVTITNEVKDYAPALGYLCDMAANVVHDRAMRIIQSEEAERGELLCHLLLHELQKLLSDYIRESVHHNHKRTAVSDGYVSSTPFNKAVAAICDLQKRMQEYKISDVSGRNLVTLKKPSQASEPKNKQVSNYGTPISYKLVRIWKQVTNIICNACNNKRYRTKQNRSQTKAALVQTGIS